MLDGRQGVLMPSGTTLTAFALPNVATGCGPAPKQVLAKPKVNS